MNRQDRAVSPVISTILMVAVVVILATIVSVAFLGIAEDITDPGPTVGVDAEFSARSTVDPHWVFRITHISGDNIEPGNLEVRLIDDRGGKAVGTYPGPFTTGQTVRVGLWGATRRSDSTSCDAPPKAVSEDDQLDGFENSAHATEVRVVVVHEPSKTLMDEVEVDLSEMPRRWTGDERHYIVNGSTPSFNCGDVPSGDDDPLDN